MTSVVEGFTTSPVFAVLLAFVAGYPLIAGTTAVLAALMFAVRRERRDNGFYTIDDAELPRISLLVPAAGDGAALEATLTALHDLDYPDYEVVVVDDEAPDELAAVAREHLLADRRFQLLRKELTEGRPAALNDALPMITGALVVLVETGSRPHRGSLRALAAHFVRLPRVGAVLTSPRVHEPATLVAALQNLEYAALVSLNRRAQVVWGRVLSVSGVPIAFRRSALEDVGLFDPLMLTEDVDLVWRLQERFYDVRYEPRAQADLAVPDRPREWWRQRRRAMTGLVQILVHRGRGLAHWRYRRQWPVAAGAALSIVWVHALVVTAAVWVCCLLTGVRAKGAAPFPNGWWVLLAAGCVVRIGAGLLLHARYDRPAWRSFLVAPLYALGYWFALAAVTVRSTLPVVLGRWSPARERLAVPDRTLRIAAPPTDG